jgi:hypothetical protein
VLRRDRGPQNQLDFDDRHDTRATESPAMANRYAKLRGERRKDDRHRVALGLVVLATGVGVVLAAYVVLARMFPEYAPVQVAQIVGLAFIAGGGGVAARSLARAVRGAYDRRGGNTSGTGSL